MFQSPHELRLADSIRELPSKPAAQLLLGLVGLLLVAAISAVEHATGHHLSLAVLYFVPLSLTWYCGRRVGIALALAAALTWLGADLASGHRDELSSHLLNALFLGAYFLLIVRILAELKERVVRERELATIDALTGLKNVRAFKDEANLLLSVADRSGAPFALGYIDLDRFKQVNDTLGHDAGDRVLQSVGEQLRSLTRQSDIAGRLGGDEFGVVLVGIDFEGARVFFDKLQRTIAANLSEHGWPVGLSIGVVYAVDAKRSLNELLRKADALMYRVKRERGNGVGYEAIDRTVRSQGRSTPGQKR